jgi:hypothetical protein
VIHGAQHGVFRLTLKKAGSDEPDFGKHANVPIDQFERAWVKHPDSSIDLAVLPLASVLKTLEGQGALPFYKSFRVSDLADEAFLSDLSAIEDIVMVGYPNGLWDSRNNLPMVRQGITATPAYIDFEGRPHFMIDCACFPGSSGSPVLLYNPVSHIDKKGNTVLGGARMKLLGVLWGGPQHNAEGEIKAVPVPTTVRPIAISRIPNNLGFCVKANQLMYFERHFRQMLDEASKSA